MAAELPFLTFPTGSALRALRSSIVIGKSDRCLCADAFLFLQEPNAAK